MSQRSRTIQGTLLTGLLEHPRPIASESYRASMDLLFPSRETFRRFLLAAHAEEQYFYATEALLWLTFRYPFPPPFRLLKNLLGFERTEQGRAGAASGEYVAKDHYTHLVHLYLLGIYLFAYHKGIHDRCARFLANVQRATAPSPAEVPYLNPYELFWLAWTGFVLHHDLGYPLEKVRAPLRGDNAAFLEGFRHVLHDTIEQVLVKGLANLMALKSALDVNQPHSLGDLWLNEGACAEECEILHATGGGSGGILSRESLRKHFGRATLVSTEPDLAYRALRSIQADDRMLAILEDDAGAPLLLLTESLPKAGEKEPVRRVIALQARSNLPRGVTGKSMPFLWKAAFAHGAAPVRGGRWSYYGLKSVAFVGAVVKKIFAATAPKAAEFFARIASDVAGDNRIPPSPFMRSEDAAVAFFGYFVGPPQRNLPPQPAQDASALSGLLGGILSSIHATVRDVPELLAEAASAFLQDASSRGDIELDRLFLSRDPAQAFKTVFRYLEKNIDALTKNAAQDYGSRVHRHVELRQTAARMDSAVKELTDESGARMGISVAPMAVIDEAFSLSAVCDESDEGIKKISSELERLGLDAFCSLVATYRPSFVATDPTYDPGVFVDHGLGAAYFGSRSALAYEAIVRFLATLSESVNEGDAVLSLLRLGFIVETPAHDVGLKAKVQFFQRSVLPTVAIHNLYPSDLPPHLRGHRTTVEKHPFGFLCLLADGLQPWDREKQVNQSLGVLPHGIYGARFNLEVEGESLRVHVRGPGLSIIDEERRLRSALAEYLGAGARIVRFDFSE